MRRLRDIIARPSVSVFLLVLLLYSLWRVPSADTSACSVRGWTLPGIKVGTAERSNPISVFLVRDGAGFRVEDLDRSSTQGLIDALQKNADDVIRAELIYERHAQGLYDVTSFRDEYSVRLRPLGKAPLSAADESKAKAAFAGWLGSKRGGNVPTAAEAISGVDPDLVMVNWPGIMNTVGAGTVLVLFLVSLAWVPRAIGDARARRTARLLRAGRCPRCKYEIAGLAGVCPECGRPIA